MNWALKLLNIRSEEKKISGVLFFFSFVIGLARVFALNASQAIFLTHYDAGDLAYVYVIASLATMLVSTVYLRLSRTLSPRSLTFVNLAFVLGFTLLIRLALGMSGAAWPAMVLAAWYYALFPLTNLAFWSAATKLVDIRQGKRLFPVVATGDVLAFSLGGFAILGVAGVVSNANLLVISAAATVSALFTFSFLLRMHGSKFAQPNSVPHQSQRKKAVTWSSPYLRLMIGYFVLSTLVFVFVDNAFNNVVQERYDEVTRTRFFGTYSAVTAIVNFSFRSLGAGRIIGRFGVIAGLLGVPVMVFLGSSAVAIGGSMWGAVALVFWLMTFTRMSDKVFRGVQTSSLATLYQPLMGKGPSVQATLEGIVDAAAMGSAGLFLLLLHKLFDIGAVQLGFFLIVFCVIWFGVAVALKREYVGMLANALYRRRIGASSLTITDDDVLGLVTEQLESPYPENAIYALDLLERSGQASLPSALVRLLDHASDRVQVEAIRRIEKHRVRSALGAIRGKINDDSCSDDLRGEAIRVFCALSEDGVSEGIAALDHEVPRIRRGALVGLLRSGSIEGVVYAGAELLHDVRSTDARKRIFAAEVLAEAEISSFYRQVLQLLDDPDAEVQCSALAAAARMDSPELWPRIVDSLRDPRLRSAATEVLIRGGKAAVKDLASGFSDCPTDRQLRLGILRIMGLIRGSEAAEELWNLAGLDDPEERHAVFVALSNCSFEPMSELAPQLRDLLQREVRDATLRFVILTALGDETSADLLVSSLEYEISLIRHRIFLLLSYLYPSSDAVAAWDNYSAVDRARRAYALELVENFVSSDLKVTLFPVLDEADISERVTRLTVSFPVEHNGVREWISYILADGKTGFSSWTQECARHALGRLEPSAEAQVKDSSVVARTMRLRSVDLFKEMPEPVLARLAPKLVPIRLGESDTVFRKGEVGDSLYVVDEGSVRIEDDGVTVAHLGENAVFGEFTVLQSAPRTASATAAVETRLLRFDQADLFQLIAEQVSVARSMIQLILRRLDENREGREVAGSVSRISISLTPLG